MKKFLLAGLMLGAMGTQAQSWTQQTSNFPKPGSYPLVITAANATTVWAMAADGTGEKENLQSYTRTSNGGTSWTGGTMNLGLGTSNLLISDISAVSATTAFVIATNENGGAGGGVWKTTDGGATWAKQTIPGFTQGTAFPNVIHFFDENVGVCMGDPDSTGRYELYNTTNGGATWTRNPAANSPAINNEYAYTHLKATAGNTIWFGTDQGRVMKSNDKGVTWTISSTPIIDFGGFNDPTKNGMITIKDANTAWLMDQDGIVYSSPNWDIVDVESGTVYSSDFTYVPGTNNTLISGGAKNGARGSSISIDGGKNWTELTPAAGDSNGIPTVIAYNASAIYGGGFSDPDKIGGMNKLGPLLATSNTSLSKNAVSIYPNPTKGQVNIESKSSVKSILLVDMNGRTVKTFENIKQLDLSGLQKGVYMLNVTLADGQKTSTKLIKD